MSSVAIVGGGIAGLAAGCALADAGYQVTLLERKPFLGGRASSYVHPGTGEVVDNCQHVLLGCCTNLIDFYRRIGAAEEVRWFGELTFLTPGGERSQLQAGRWPAPFHSSASFLRARFLGWRDKVAIARGLTSMMRGPLRDEGASFLAWLRAHGQTERAIRRFWEPVLVSALNEDLDRVSVRYAAKVFRDSFLKSARAGEMGVPTVPLSDLYARAATYIEARGGRVRTRTSVEAIATDGELTLRLGLEGSGEALTADYLVMAAPWHAAGKLLGEQAQLSRLESSSITGIHLWFDRKITELAHAVLLDRTIQWMFHKSVLQPQRGESGSYIEVVVSASKRLVDKPRAEIIELALRELAEFFPAVREAKLEKATVVKELNATYSVLPGADGLRPPQATADRRVFLAGDWTDTGWPATMEGAVRSGYLAAEALTESGGERREFLVADLPPAGCMRLFPG